MTSTVDPEIALAAFMHHMSVEDYLDLVNRMLEGQDEESDHELQEEHKDWCPECGGIPCDRCDNIGR